MGIEDPRETFERRLVREILGAERVRARLLFAIPTIALFALVVVGGAYPEAVASLLHGRIDTAPVGLFLIIVAGFELYVLFWIRGLLARDEAPKTGRRYLHAFVETSMPTAVILYYATGDGPVQALLMPSAFMYSIFILLSTLGLDFFLCTFTGVVAAGEYALIAFLWGTNDTHVVEPALSSVPHHLGKAIVLLVSGVAAGFVARRLRSSFTSAIESVGERARIVSVFGQHVSPEVVERLIAGKTEVKSETRTVCVMFLDIRNFTAFCENKSPEEVVDYLNDVFEATIDAVVSRHGIVNKFLGDGYMAVFGAPIARGQREPRRRRRRARDRGAHREARRRREDPAHRGRHRPPHRRRGRRQHRLRAAPRIHGDRRRRERRVAHRVAQQGAPLTRARVRRDLVRERS